MCRETVQRNSESDISRSSSAGSKRRSSRLRRSTYLYLRTAITELERTRFGEALDRFDLCVVLGDALGCQMWIVEARSHDDSDTLDCSRSEERRVGKEWYC